MGFRMGTLPFCVMSMDRYLIQLWIFGRFPNNIFITYYNACIAWVTFLMLSQLKSLLIMPLCICLTVQTDFFLYTGVIKTQVFLSCHLSMDKPSKDTKRDLKFFSLLTCSQCNRWNT